MTGYVVDFTIVDKGGNALDKINNKAKKIDDTLKRMSKNDPLKNLKVPDKAITGLSRIESALNRVRSAANRTASAMHRMAAAGAYKLGRGIGATIRNTGSMLKDGAVGTGRGVNAATASLVALAASAFSVQQALDAVRNKLESIDDRLDFAQSIGAKNSDRVQSIVGAGGLNNIAPGAVRDAIAQIQLKTFKDLGEMKFLGPALQKSLGNKQFKKFAKEFDKTSDSVEKFESIIESLREGVVKGTISMSDAVKGLSEITGRGAKTFAPFILGGKKFVDEVHEMRRALGLFDTAQDRSASDRFEKQAFKTAMAWEALSNAFTRPLFEPIISAYARLEEVFSNPNVRVSVSMLAISIGNLISAVAGNVTADRAVKFFDDLTSKITAFTGNKEIATALSVLETVNNALEASLQATTNAGQKVNEWLRSIPGIFDSISTAIENLWNKVTGLVGTDIDPETKRAIRTARILDQIDQEQFALNKGIGDPRDATREAVRGMNKMAMDNKTAAIDAGNSFVSNIDEAAINFAHSMTSVGSLFGQAAIAAIASGLASIPLGYKLPPGAQQYLNEPRRPNPKSTPANSIGGGGTIGAI